MKTKQHLVPIEEIFDKRFKDEKEAMGFLQSCLEEGGLSLFLAGLQEVVRAQGGMARFAKKLRVPRQTLYRALSKTGNPEARTVWAIMDGLGITITLGPKKSGARAKRSGKLAKAA